MEVLAGALLVALVVIVAFARRLEKERRDVFNRGVNQSPLVTIGRALSATLVQAIAYAVLVYVLIAGYTYVRFRNQCRAEPDSRLAYEADSLIDHLREALRWPLTYSDGPACKE